MRNDSGSVIVGYFTKIALVFTVFGVLCFDAVSVGVARVAVEDIAREAAVAGSASWDATKNEARAYRAAVGVAEEHGAEIPSESFTVAEDGTVTLRVEKEATTLLLYRVKKSAGWAHVGATGSGRSV